MRSFTVGKFYAVLDGHSKKPMILESWDACKREVTGAKGVKFKSFPSKDEALDFIRIHGQDLPDTEKSDAAPKPVEKKEHDKDGVVIYVDGSYELTTQRYAYGMVVVHEGEEIHSECEAVKGEYSAMRNVAGEVLGAMKAMTYAKENGFSHLTLYFDYQGIESWAIGTWKRNNPLTQGYHTFYQNMRTDLTVKFMKVKGHSGDRFNDRADEIAKSAFLKG